MKRLIIITLLFLTGCGTLSKIIPETLGEKNSGFTYIPLDPLTVQYKGCSTSRPDYNIILDQLPDNAVRIATKKINAKTDSTFGSVGVGLAGEEYKIVLDYVNVDNTNIPFEITITQDPYFNPVSNRKETKVRYKVERLSLERAYDVNFGTSSRFNNFSGETKGIYVIPVYVGVGLRLTSEIKVLNGNVNLSSLPGIAASVEAGNASGSLVVQTLGITGKQTSTGLIFSSDLNETTVQSAVLSLGKIKAILYTDDAIIRPRVTGMYLPLPDGAEELVNLIVSELAREPIPWKHPSC